MVERLAGAAGVRARAPDGALTPTSMSAGTRVSVAIACQSYFPAYLEAPTPPLTAVIRNFRAASVWTGSRYGAMRFRQ